MCLEQMSKEELKAALEETKWQIEFLNGEIKRLTSKLKTQEFLKCELEQLTTEEKAPITGQDF